MKQTILFSVSPEELASIVEEAVKVVIENSKKADEQVDNEERITRQELSERYKLSVGTIHNYMKSGDLPFEKVGHKTLFRKEDIENFLQAKRKNL